MKYENDIKKTISNKERLETNNNLLYWYKVLFETQFNNITNLEKKNILEIGSGTSPIKHFYPFIKTSDILNLYYLDYIFDCHEINNYSLIQDESIDIISVTNVLHHLKEPVEFMINVSKKLRSDGIMIIAEPYFSLLSTLIYKYLHHEPVEFDIKEPVLKNSKSPLTSANIALPYLIFFKNSEWLSRLSSKYVVDKKEVSYFSFISYYLTGGISCKYPFPHFIYKLIFKFDNFISKLAPNIFASFFIVRLKKTDAL